MVGSGGIAGADAPGHLGKDQHEQKKEDAGDFEKDDSADARKGPEKTSYSARDAPRFARNGRAYGLCRRSAGSCGGLRRSGLGGGKPFARHASGHAHPHAENPADFLWSHSIKMLPRAPAVACLKKWNGALLFHGFSLDPLLLSGRTGSKVEKS